MTHFSTQDRQKWMGLLARAPAITLQERMRDLGDLPPFSEIRSPEVGMIMVRGRIAGSGDPFNLGEMTVTRCTVAALGLTGHAMVQGRRPDHARRAALADVLLQDGGWHDLVVQHVIASLRAREAEEEARRIADTDGTKVDFFTLVRGEDGQ